MADIVLVRLVLFILFVALWFSLAYLWFHGGFKRADTPSPSSAKVNRHTSGLQPIKDFEYDTARLIQATTGKEARVSDRGGLADIEVFDKTGQLMGIVHCVPLALAYTFSPSDVQMFHEFKQRQRIKVAYLVTSGRFEREAQEAAQRLGIKMLDGDALQRLRQKYKQAPARMPSDPMSDDYSRWQRPGGPPVSSKPVSLFNEEAPRHVMITGTPTVIVPRETVDPPPVSYTPSVRPAGPAVWPNEATRRNMPTALIKTIDPDSLADNASVEQKLQARKFKTNRIPPYKRPSDG